MSIQNLIQLAKLFIILLFHCKAKNVRRIQEQQDSIENHCQRPYNSSMFFPRVKENCPASNLINMKFDGLEAYPMDIYDQELFFNFTRNGQSPFDNKDIFRCNANVPPVGFEQQNYACSTLTRCPIMQQNIDNFMERASKWKTKHNLCHFRNAIGSIESDAIIVVVGGSVTFGSGAVHCYCDPKIDSKCSISPFVKDQYNEFDYERCRWSSVFGRWVKSIGNPNIKIANLADGGINSILMSEDFISTFKYRGLRKLKKHDIVLIDHSVNDALTSMGTTTQLHELYHGLNSLIMKIFDVSEHHSLPTIIIMETYPYNHYQEKPKPPELDYVNVYNLISQKYLIPIWSMREVVWSDIADTLMYPFINILRFNCQPDQHPGNSYHLYLSDLLASSFIRELSKCHDDKGVSLTNSRSEEEMDLMTFVSKKEIDVLVCSEDEEDILSFSASTYSSTSTLMDIIITPNSSWEIIDESRHRIGWISEDSINENIKKRDTDICQSSSLTGIVYNDEKLNYISIIAFPVNVELIRRVPFSLLEIEYLRTYFNGGAADVFLCNKYIATIDTIWKDYEHYKYSFPQKLSISLSRNSDDGIVYCKADDPNGNALLEIKRRCPTPEEPELLEARNRGKVKIIKTRICQERTGP